MYLLATAGVSADIYTYYQNENNNMTTISYFSNKSDVQFPTTLGGVTVDTIGSFTFCGDKTISSIDIPNNVTTVE
jgi:hypothetical protein